MDAIVVQFGCECAKLNFSAPTRLYWDVVGMGVFRNREALFHDYVPLRLPHRERGFEELLGYFKPVLSGGSASKCMLTGR